MTPSAESFLSLTSVGAVALGLSEEVLRCSDADALVVPVNRDYDLDRGELAALRDAAGPMPEIQSLLYGLGDPGTALPVRTGNLRAKFLVLAVAVDETERLEAETLRRSVAAALDVCMERNLPRVLVRDFGALWPGLPPGQVAGITVRTVAEGLGLRYPAMDRVAFSADLPVRGVWRMALDRLAGREPDWSLLPKDAVVCGLKGIRKRDVMRALLQGARTPEAAASLLGLEELHRSEDCACGTATGEPCSVNLREALRTYDTTLRHLAPGFGGCGAG